MVSLKPFLFNTSMSLKFTLLFYYYQAGVDHYGPGCIIISAQNTFLIVVNLSAFPRCYLILSVTAVV